MTKSSSSSWSSRRAATAAAAVLARALPAVPAAGAGTVLSHTVELALSEDGSFTERRATRVRLDDAADLADWSPWVVPLDDDRTLVTVSAAAWRPDGSVVVLDDDDTTTVEGFAGGGIFHSSAAARLLEFPPLPAGSRLQVTSEVRVEPWMTSSSIPLAFGDVPIEELVVAVSGGGSRLRWRIDPPPSAEGAEEPRFRVEEEPGRLRVTASGLEPTDGAGPVLRLAWGEEESWSDVGRWYERLTREVPRRPPEVAALARELVAGETDPRAKTASLLDYVRRRVRYVAVEVGVGGLRPSAPGEVLERRWGDCKDKSFLLVDLLAEAGIAAYPALIRSDEERGVDDAFPGADQFNHAIVAVPVTEVEPRAGDAASESYLFLDPTQEVGGLAWLHPAIQGQAALVVRGESSELAVLPVAPGHERRDLTVRLTVRETGEAAGEAVYRLTGRGAWILSGTTASAAPGELSVLARRVLAGPLPGAVLGDPRWRQGDEGGVPVVELSAPVRFERLVEGRRTRSLALPGTGAFPAPSDLDPEPTGGWRRSLTPVAWRAAWELELPAGWCLPEPAEDGVENSVGSFRQVVAATPEGGLRVERRAETARRWLDRDLAADARELALAESRTARRRLRLACPEEP